MAFRSYRTPARLAGLALTAGLLAACGGGGDDPLTGSSGEEAPSDTIVVGSANFSENVILAQIYAQALDAAGVKTETKLNIGSRETYIPALQDGSIDMIPEYTGNTLALLRRLGQGDPERRGLHRAAGGAAGRPTSVLEKSSAEDKDVIVVRAGDSRRSTTWTSIADLKPVDDQLVVGGSAGVR